MKKTFLLLVFCIMHFGLLLGQTNKGNVLLGLSTAFNLAGSEDTGAGIGFTKTKIKSDDESNSSPGEFKSFGFNFSPKVGYFVANNFAVSLLLNYGYTKTRTDGEGYEGIDRNYSLGPFLRYYIPLNKVMPFFEVGSSIGEIYSKGNYSGNFNSEYKRKTGESTITAGVGMAVPLGEKVTFDLLAGYNNQVTKSKENNDNNVRIVSHTVGLDLGVTILLGNKE